MSTPRRFSFTSQTRLSKEKKFGAVSTNSKSKASRGRVAKVCELIKSVQGFADAMTMLDPDWKDDARLVRRVRDFARDSVLETASSLLRPREPRAPR